MPHKELHKVVTSVGYESNIHIPLVVQPSTAYRFVNESETATISITIKEKTISYPPKSYTDGFERFERDWFTEIDIDSDEIGHKFQLGLYRG